VDVGEHANHLLNHRGVRYPSEDRIGDPHDVSDYIWVVCRFIAATSRELKASSPFFMSSRRCAVRLVLVEFIYFILIVRVYYR
jgi:hypothetical protein